MLVVILFLQTWRASIIPLIAVPVSIVGTFACAVLLGFTINTLTLFGLVLAIGIVVDDAIVVVENVERNIEEGCAPREAAHQAMGEVSGPIIAIALVLCAVFVPMAFLTGVTGQFYKQFAVTIAISTVISAINSLTLSPALAARAAAGRTARRRTRCRALIDRLFGWVFRPFNRFFSAARTRYQGARRRARCAARPRVRRVCACCSAAPRSMFQAVPGGFIPTQDKLYLIAGVKLPEGASLDRTDAALTQMTEIALRIDGVANAVAFPGLNAAAVHQHAEHRRRVLPAQALRRAPPRAPRRSTTSSTRSSPAIQEGFAFSLMPPPILGLGNGVGLFAVHRGPRRSRLRRAAERASSALPGHGRADAGHELPDQHATRPTCRSSTLQVDRVKAKAQGVPLTELFDTLQTYLGSAYVNDFNLFGRT